ncbi:hypothetical protein HKX48_007219 [Thoreauomyces humboldtii]|nr:hypothetical protein HKX48_007219 [Thoreauomyces humboldtii]
MDYTLANLLTGEPTKVSKLLDVVEYVSINAEYAGFLNHVVGAPAIGADKDPTPLISVGCWCTLFAATFGSSLEGRAIVTYGHLEPAIVAACLLGGRAVFLFEGDEVPARVNLALATGLRTYGKKFLTKAVQTLRGKSGTKAEAQALAAPTPKKMKTAGPSGSSIVDTVVAASPSKSDPTLKKRDSIFSEDGSDSENAMQGVVSGRAVPMLKVPAGKGMEALVTGLPSELRVPSEAIETPKLKLKSKPKPAAAPFRKPTARVSKKPTRFE